MGRAFENTFLQASTKDQPRREAVNGSTRYPFHASDIRPAEESVAMFITSITSRVVTLRREWEAIVRSRTEKNWRQRALNISAQIIPAIVEIMQNNQWTLPVQREIRTALGDNAFLYIGNAESITRQRQERRERKIIQASETAIPL